MNITDKEYNSLNWIEWNGGENPIKEGQKFVTKLRGDAAVQKVFGIKNRAIGEYDSATRMWWDHHDEDSPYYGGDIVAYAIVE